MRPLKRLELLKTYYTVILIKPANNIYDFAKYSNKNAGSKPAEWAKIIIFENFK